MRDAYALPLLDRYQDCVLQRVWYRVCVLRR